MKSKNSDAGSGTGTSTQRLASILLGEDVNTFIRSRRDEGRPWRFVVRDLYDATDGQIDVTYETLRQWAPDPEREGVMSTAVYDFTGATVTDADGNATLRICVSGPWQVWVVGKDHSKPKWREGCHAAGMDKRQARRFIRTHREAAS